jgi:hypothetical protein
MFAGGFGKPRNTLERVIVLLACIAGLAFIGWQVLFAISM